jgi:hypothetical protein
MLETCEPVACNGFEDVDDSNVCRNHLAFAIRENSAQRQLQKLPATFNRIYMNNIPDTTGMLQRPLKCFAASNIALALRCSKTTMPR